jgi:probable rRNA maturation factor
MARIHFFVEDVTFKLPNPTKVSRWIHSVITSEGFSLENLNYVFCSDEYLREMNIQYLNHKTFTDIITFSATERPGTIEGDIFISIERVIENAAKFDQQFIDELHRVMIHGVLHLVGFKDKSPRDKKLMRQKEDAYLSLRNKVPRGTAVKK